MSTFLVRPSSGLVSRVVRGVVTAPQGVRRALGAANRRLDYTDSPQFHDGLFHNRLPASPVVEGSRFSMAKDLAGKRATGKPSRPVEVVHPDLPETAGDLAATWLGHSSVLLELAGHWVLTDPVFSERVSPSPSIGPRRLHPVPMQAEELPRLSAVLISHDHYDHLDTATIDTLVATQGVPFVVPLGIGVHLARWGVPEHRIVELDWEESVELDGLTLTCAEAQHFSGRFLGGNTTLWASWVLAAGERTVWFGGDTGWTPAFEELGRQHGPFDLTLLPIGAYDARWRDVHMDPEEAVRAHLVTGGEVFVPIHWATYDLAFHAWSDPVEWLLREAGEHGVRLALPRPGARTDLTGELPTDAWWRASV